MLAGPRDELMLVPFGAILGTRPALAAGIGLLDWPWLRDSGVNSALYAPRAPSSVPFALALTCRKSCCFGPFPTPSLILYQRFFVADGPLSGGPELSLIVLPCHSSWYLACSASPASPSWHRSHYPSFCASNTSSMTRIRTYRLQP